MQLIPVPELCSGRSHCVEVAWVVHPLSLWKNTVWELRRDWNGVIHCLFPVSRGPISELPYLRIVLEPVSVLSITATLFFTSLLLFFATSFRRLFFILTFVRASSLTVILQHLHFIDLTLLHFFLLFEFLRCIG